MVQKISQQMGLAHCLTLLRIFVSPVFPVLYLGYEWLGIPFQALPFVLLFLLLICECSDLIDGIIARRCNQVTDLGKVLDPMADSITRLSLFLTFTQGPVALPLLIVLIFLYRDLIITTLRTLCALRGVALAARPSGKIKAVLQAIALFIILLFLAAYSQEMISLDLLQKVSFYTTTITALYTALSAIDYFFANRTLIKKVF